MKTELELKLEEIVVETDELILLQTRVAKALEASREPLRVTLLCVEERSDGKRTTRLPSSYEVTAVL